MAFSSNFSRQSIVASALFALAPVAAVQAAVSPLELVGPVAEYKLYVAENAGNLVKDVRAFTDAVKAGDVEKAKSLFAPTRMHYERIEPVAELFSDLDVTIDSRADDHEKAENDPGFIGFHRIEYVLWEKNSTEGLDPIADKLMADVTELQKRLVSLTVPPEKVVGGAAVLMEEVAATKISGEEDRYSHTDLWDFQGNFEGGYKIFELLRDLIKADDPAFVEKTEANFKTVFDVLKTYRNENGEFQSYEKLSERDRRLLSARVNTLAEDLSTLRGKLGLD